MSKQDRPFTAKEFKIFAAWFADRINAREMKNEARLRRLEYLAEKAAKPSTKK